MNEEEGWSADATWEEVKTHLRGNPAMAKSEQDGVAASSIPDKTNSTITNEGSGTKKKSIFDQPLDGPLFKLGPGPLFGPG